MTWWDVKHGVGAASNGGGFDPTNTNFATDGSATSATGTAPVFSSGSYTFVAGDVGAWLYVKSGSNTIPGFYKISSVSAGAATLDAAIGHASNTTNSPNSADAAAYVGFIGGTNAVAGIATTASPSSITWGVDYAQNANGVRTAYTDMVIDAVTNTKFTSAGNPCGPHLVGNVINVTSGTGFTVQRVLVSSVSGVTATCDRALGTVSSTAGNGNLGGALDTMQHATDAMDGDSHTIWVTGNANIAVEITDTVGKNYWLLVGYGTTRGDGVLVTLTATASIAAILGPTTRMTMAWNFDLHGNANATNCFTWFSVPISASVFQGLYYCKLHHATAAGASSGNPTTIYFYCEAYSNTGDGFAGYYDFHKFCYSHNNGAIGFSMSNTGGQAYGCIAYSNSGNGFVRYEEMRHCLSHSNTGTGFGAYNQIYGLQWLNCIAWGNGAYGFVPNTATPTAPTYYNWLMNNAAGSNTSGRGTVHPQEIGAITLTVDPCISASGGNFALNATAGGGAACRAAGWQTTWPGASATINALDVGPVQHGDPVYLDFNDAAANDELTQVSTDFPTGSTVEFRTGSSPGGSNAATGTLLATVTTQGWGTPAVGSMAILGSWTGGAVASGTAGYARFKNAGATKNFDIPIGAGSGQLNIDVNPIVNGSTLTIASATLTA